MIPVLGVPVLNRYDLLYRMLASVDVPMERVVVVDNGSRLGTAPEGVRVIDCGVNLGVAASWNLIIKSTIDAPWWLLVNNDVVFGPGELAALAGRMDDDHGSRVVCLAGFAAVAINAAVMDVVGWFDEGFAPMYYEDSDWAYRAKLHGIHAEHIGSTTVHTGEQATRSDPAVASANAVTQVRNQERYVAKWGGVVGQERYATPWGGRSDPEPPISRMRMQRW